MPGKLKCSGVPYRQGFIEVIPNIHKGYINIETWMIHPDHDLTGREFGDVVGADDAVMKSTELELTMDAATALIQLLQTAIDKVKKASNP